MDNKINEDNYWEILINYSNKKHSIPFIIGAKKILLPDTEYDTVKELMLKMKNSITSKIYNLNYCGDIGEYVILATPKKYKLNGSEIINPVTNEVSFVLTQSTEILGVDLEAVITKLETKYANNLLHELFSIDYGKWRKFNKNEVNIIKEIMK